MDTKNICTLKFLVFFYRLSKFVNVFVSLDHGKNRIFYRIPSIVGIGCLLNLHDYVIFSF